MVICSLIKRRELKSGRFSDRRKTRLMFKKEKKKTITSILQYRMYLFKHLSKGAKTKEINKKPHLTVKL